MYDTIGDFPSKVNRGMVEITRLEDPGEIAEVKRLIERHREHTGSEIADSVLRAWDESVGVIHRVISPAYRRVLEATV